MGGWLAGWMIVSNNFFVERYLTKYTRSEVGTLHVGEYSGRLMPIFDPYPDPGTLDPDLDLDRHQVAFIPVSSCCRSYTEEPSDEGTLRVLYVYVSQYSASVFLHLIY